MVSRRCTGLVSAVMAAGLLVIGWWPFAFSPENRVDWLEGRPGLRFRPDGIVYDPEPLGIAGPADARGQPASFTVELWLASAREPDSGLLSILTIHDGRLPSGFVLCQWKSELVLRIPAASGRGFREGDIRGALSARETHFVTVVGDAHGTAFSIDGKSPKRVSGLVIPAGAFDGRLVLGNAADGGHPWSGELYGCAVFGRALTEDETARHRTAWAANQAAGLGMEPDLRALYLFDEGQGQWAADRSPLRHRLRIPRTYHMVQKVFLSLPPNGEGLARSGRRDLVVNFLGFVPFGLVVFLHLRRNESRGRLRSGLYAVCCGGVVSLLIEIVQVWLPNRSSSILDLGCNVAGTLFGVLLALALGSHSRPSAS